MNKLRSRLIWILLLTNLVLTGCVAHHAIAFEDTHYAIDAKKQNTSIIAVIDQQTLNQKVSIRSFMVGAGHSWDAEPGQMLKQVADIELPQMFEHYEFASDYQESNSPGQRIILKMQVPDYQFKNFKATITVQAIASTSKGEKLFTKTYTAAGDTQGAKMYWGGPFAMKSAVRQSSLEAYKKIFEQIRGDLAKAMESIRS